MNSALDECSYSAAISGSGPGGLAMASRVKSRLNEEMPMLQNLSVHSGLAGEKESCQVSATVHLSLPLGFGRDYGIEGRIHYRDFDGKKYSRNALGAEGLESNAGSTSVWIFPQSGTRYHSESCTYVKACVHGSILTDSLKSRYSACEMCDSGSLPTGSIVFCFSGDDTAYHRGSCRCINRHTIVIDKSEAEKRGYSPCSKCGGN
ncbi:MAG: hypothetical protein MJ161_06075 [Clostridia bacterium]|nr:hypothetical protein [Clostridia bacterium]